MLAAEIFTQHAKGSHLACWVKISAENILKYFSDFSQEIDFDSSCKFSPHANCLKRKQFAQNIKIYFLGKLGEPVKFSQKVVKAQ